MDTEKRDFLPMFRFSLPIALHAVHYTTSKPELVVEGTRTKERAATTNTRWACPPPRRSQEALPMRSAIVFRRGQVYVMGRSRSEEGASWMKPVRHHPQAGGLMSGAASKAVTCLV